MAGNNNRFNVHNNFSSDFNLRTMLIIQTEGMRSVKAFQIMTVIIKIRLLAQHFKTIHELTNELILSFISSFWQQNCSFYQQQVKSKWKMYERREKSVEKYFINSVHT
jgi:hypothetical protein